MRTLIWPLLFLCLSLISCSSANQTFRQQTKPSVEKDILPADALPIPASAYEKREPVATEEIHERRINSNYTRRIFKDPHNQSVWQELIIGTGSNADKIYAYFYFVPRSVVIRAEHDIKMLRWGLLASKFNVLSNQPPEAMSHDTDLFSKALNAADFFYPAIHGNRMAMEGVDIRGIHLALRPYGESSAVIIGVTSKQWERIRTALMHNEKNDLYSLFPQ